MYSGRFDYVKASMSLHTENAQQLAKIWYDTFEGEDRNESSPRSAHVNSVRNNSDGSRLYIFEAWGPASVMASLLDFRIWGEALDRVDVRCDMDVTHNGIDRMYQHLRRNKAGNRNVTLYTSKTRSKRSGRDTGGYGIAIGSHKSDMRVTMYKRGNERGAYEIQYAGKKLDTSVKSCISSKLYKPDVTNEEVWNWLKTSILANGNTDMAGMAGLDYNEIFDMLADNAPVPDETEHILADIDAMIDDLPRDAQQALLTGLQMRLF